jgi:hypothetical protein
MTEHRVPEEQDITEADQELAIRAIRATERVTAPGSLRASVERMAAASAPAPRPRPWRRPVVLGGAVGALAAAVVVLVLVLSGSSGPSVEQATRAALAPPVTGPPARRPGQEVLSAEVDGVAYPYWSDSSGWRAVGTRRDTVGGREVMTVVYADARGRRIGYAIAAGGALPADGGRVVSRDGRDFRVLRVRGADVVTWERQGQTCILASRDTGADVMLGLASGGAA